MFHCHVWHLSQVHGLTFGTCIQCIRTGTVSHMFSLSFVLSQVHGLTFGLYDKEDILKLSAVEIFTPISFNQLGRSLMLALVYAPCINYVYRVLIIFLLFCPAFLPVFSLFLLVHCFINHKLFARL